MSHKKKNQKSKIRLLPAPVREELDRLLREDRMTQTAILEQVNALCEAHETDTISRSGLNRYSQKMEAMGRKIREMREVSGVWVAKLGEAPTSDIGKMLHEAVRTLAFECSMQMNEADVPDLKALNQLALIAQRVEKASIASLQREKEIRTAFAEEVADTAEAALVNQGMTAETIETIKKEILGIA